MTQDFFEKAVLLALTALVTGFAVPFILKRIEERRARDQKRFEADLARQNKLIDAQVKLIEDLATLLWEFQLSFIAVTYYSLLNPELYDASLKTYEDQSIVVLGKIRAEISKSIRLVPEETYAMLKELYYDELLGIDTRLSTLTRQKGSRAASAEGWHALNTYAVYTLSEKVDGAIDRVAAELQLKSGRGGTAV